MEQKQSKTNVREMALIALMAAVTCILGPLSVPIGVVPISLTNFAIYLAIYVLGCRRGTISYIVYLLLGLVCRSFPASAAALASCLDRPADT